ncbi:MAG: hypothetical protein ACFFGP_04945 [Promethearchaeota archaeon]
MGEIRIILDVTLSSLLILGYLFIAIAGAFNLKREEKLNGSIFLIIIGAVEILYEILKFRLYNMILTVMGYTLESMSITYTIWNIIPYIISIFTFGILIIILGKKNKENFGKTLLLSGIFWIVYSVMILIKNIVIFPFSLLPIPPIVVITFQIVAVVFITFMVLSRIFLMLYGSKISERYLFGSSIILLIASTVLIIYSILGLIMIYMP